MTSPLDPTEIHAFVDGELDAQRRAEVERLLADDADAAAEAKACLLYTSDAADD